MSIFEKIMLAIRNYVEKSTEDNQDYKIYVRNNQEAIISMLKNTPAFHEPAVATRTILIAYAFEAGLSLDELEDLIAEYQCEALYTRNIEDYSLIYAFNHHKTYGEWIRLVKDAQALREGAADDTHFKDGITVPNLRNYIASVRDFSEDSNGRSKGITLNLEKSVLENQTDEDFADAIINNISDFVGNRETARRKLVGALLSCIDYWQEKGDPVPWVASGGKQSIVCKTLINSFSSTFPGLIVNKNSGIPENINAFLQSYIDLDAHKDSEEAIARYLTKVIKGSADINRLLFMFLLVFLQTDMETAKSIQDINDILSACGWQTLSENSAFDRLAKECIECSFTDNMPTNISNEAVNKLFKKKYEKYIDEYLLYCMDGNWESKEDYDSIIKSAYEEAQEEGYLDEFLKTDLAGNLKNRTKGENFAKAIQTQTNEHKE